MSTLSFYDNIKPLKSEMTEISFALFLRGFVCEFHTVCAAAVKEKKCEKLPEADPARKRKESRCANDR